MIPAQVVRYFHNVAAHSPRRGPKASDAPRRTDPAEEKLPVVVVGLGAIGRKVAVAALRHPELQLLGAVDPRLAGQSLRSLLPGAPDRPVEAAPGALYRRCKGGVALICTASLLEAVVEEIERAVRAGLHVVSSCEELAHAAFTDPEQAARLDELALRHGVAILGTGVNPGFVFDRLIATFGQVVGEVRRVEARRVVDLLGRRRSLHRKLGIGLALDAFDARAEEGRVGHVGLVESCGLIAEGLGLEIDEVEESIDPIPAAADLEAEGVRVEAGRVAGVRQRARAFAEGKELIHLELEFRVAAEEPGDRLRIEADPPVELTIPGGIAGDEGSAWALVHAAPRVAAAEAGLLTVLDLPAGR